MIIVKQLQHSLVALKLINITEFAYKSDVCRDILLDVYNYLSDDVSIADIKAYFFNTKTALAKALGEKTIDVEYLILSTSYHVKMYQHGKFYRNYDFCFKKVLLIATEQPINMDATAFQEIAMLLMGVDCNNYIAPDKKISVDTNIPFNRRTSIYAPLNIRDACNLIKAQYKYIHCLS